MKWWDFLWSSLSNYVSVPDKIKVVSSTVEVSQLKTKVSFKCKQIFTEFHKYESLCVLLSGVYFSWTCRLSPPSAQHHSSTALCWKPSPDFFLSSPSGPLRVTLDVIDTSRSYLGGFHLDWKMKCQTELQNPPQDRIKDYFKNIYYDSLWAVVELPSNLSMYLYYHVYHPIWAHWGLSWIPGLGRRTLMDSCVIVLHN